MDDHHITLIGQVEARNDRRVFGIRARDRFAHVHILGKTGTGKSSLLEGMAAQDIAAGAGVMVLDPHGDLVARLATKVPAGRRHEVIYLDAADRSQPYGYNPLRFVGERHIALAASGLMEVFKKRWADAWGVRMEHILRNTLMALLERPDATLRDILRLYADKAFRHQVTAAIRNPTVKAFFEKEFERLAFGYRSDGIAPIQNKVGAFLADPTLRRLVTEPEVDLHLRKVMDSGGVLLINLAKGRLGEDSSSLLGGLLATTIGLAAISRADVAPEFRRPVFVYIDEFQNFTTLALAEMLAELRKYAVGFVLANQYLHQLDAPVQHAVLGNAGTLISFRLGAEDAPLISREMEERFSPTDLLRLPNQHIAIRLLINGEPSRPFSARTLILAEGA